MPHIVQQFEKWAVQKHCEKETRNPSIKTKSLVCSRKISPYHMQPSYNHWCWRQQRINSSSLISQIFFHFNEIKLLVFAWQLFKNKKEKKRCVVSSADSSIYDSKIGESHIHSRLSISIKGWTFQYSTVHNICFSLWHYIKKKNWKVRYLPFLTLFHLHLLYLFFLSNT